MVRTIIGRRVSCSGREHIRHGVSSLVRTNCDMSKHSELRKKMESRIKGGSYAVGEQLPSERSLQDEFGFSRSVIRQALGALTRDGWIVPVYPHGYTVIGPRIPWISRLEATRMKDGWSIDMYRVHEITATEEVAEALGVPPGDTVINRSSLLFCKKDKELWGLGEVYYPEDELTDQGRKLLLSKAELTYDDLEIAHKRRIVGFLEEIDTRLPTKEEARRLKVKSNLPLFEMKRLARTSTDKPISYFKFVGRSDRFKLSYAMQND